jgi:hypothetical protein
VSNKNLERSPPKLSVVAERDPRDPRSIVLPQINPEYARQFIPILLRSIDEVVGKFSLPLPRPLTTNHVGRVRLEENLGAPYCNVELTNGWRFLIKARG